MLKAFLIFTFIFNFHAQESEQVKKGKDPKRIHIFKKDKFSELKEKNGIHLENISKNFDKLYQFISVHFREDKSEIRLIYGNKLAMEGLKSKSHEYKNGAILYKVVYKTEHDPLFHASLVPESRPVVRQIMLRDTNKYQSTNGWGYAVFTDAGTTLPGDPDATLATCYACHKLASSRNDIFSWPMESVLPNKNASKVKYEKQDIVESQQLSDKLFKLEIGKFSELDPKIQDTIEQKTEKINIFTGDMNKMDFPGYITELNSFLIKETLKNKLPSVVFKVFENRLIVGFSYISSNKKNCSANEELITSGHTSYPNNKKKTSKRKSLLKKIEKCYPTT